MAINNCPICGSLYVPNGRGMCSHCAEAEDQRFEIVKRYLEDRPDAKLEEIAADTGIDQAAVLRFIRSGRLVARPQDGLTCERCGQPIETGVVCARCAKEMTMEIRSFVGSGNHSLGAKRGVRMHVLDQRPRRR